MNVVRSDNLYNIKRIAIAWHELVSQGIPTALHVNARTDKDWQSWTDFIKQRAEVNTICFEFATGGMTTERALYYVEKLSELAVTVERNLRLVIKGGQNYCKYLLRSFSSLVFIDSSAFMKAVYRRQLNWQPGDKLTERVVKTEAEAPLDFLLNRNVKIIFEMIKFNVTHRARIPSLADKTRAA